MAVCVPADSRFESGTESERAIVRPRRRPPRRRRPLPARPLVRPELGGHDTRARRYGIGRWAGRVRFLVPEQHLSLPPRHRRKLQPRKMRNQ